MRVTRAVGVGVAAWVVAVAAACGGGDDTAEDPGGDEPIEATTTTEPPTTTTTSPFYEGPEFVDGIMGSGCTPGDVGTLPEGWWAGSIRAVDGLAVDFDVMCYLAGETGIQAAWEDTGEPEMYHLRNADPRTYRVTFPSGDVPARCVSDASGDFPCTVGDLLPLYPALENTVTIGENEAESQEHVWIHVTGTTPDYLHVVDDLVEDYIPPSERGEGG